LLSRQQAQSDCNSLLEGYILFCPEHTTAGSASCECRPQNKAVETVKPAGWIQLPAAVIFEAGVPVVESINNKLRFFKPDEAY
jgi:hypothetical protein